MHSLFNKQSYITQYKKEDYIYAVHKQFVSDFVTNKRNLSIIILYAGKDDYSNLFINYDTTLSLSLPKQCNGSNIDDRIDYIRYTEALILQYLKKYGITDVFIKYLNCDINYGIKKHHYCIKLLC